MAEKNTAAKRIKPNEKGRLRAVGQELAGVDQDRRNRPSRMTAARRLPPGVGVFWDSRMSVVGKKKEKPLGDDLLSQAVSSQVPSALAGLTTGFGMGPGVPPPLQSPRGVITYEVVD